MFEKMLAQNLPFALRRHCLTGKRLHRVECRDVEYNGSNPFASIWRLLMKTDIKLKAVWNGREEICRVKLDGNKFPYIVINNEKIILNSSEFPRIVSVVYGLLTVYLEIISGQEQLKEILVNPDLTIDKISMKQQMRVG